MQCFTDQLIACGGQHRAASGDIIDEALHARGAEVEIVILATATRAVDAHLAVEQAQHAVDVRQVLMLALVEVGQQIVAIARLGGAHFVTQHRADDMNLRISRFRSEEHTSDLQSLMRISYAVFCLNKKNKNKIE